MAVVGSAALLPDTGDGTFELGRYVLRQRWRVVTNNLLDDATVVVNAPGLPIVGSAYSAAYPTLRARSYDPKRLGPASYVWAVGVEWSTPERKSGSERGGGPGGTGTEKDGEFTDPTVKLPTVKWDNTSREVLITQVVDAVTGALKPPTYSNGEVIDPPPKRAKGYVTLEISRNEPLTANHPALGITYLNAVNSDTFWGLPAGTWICKKIVADREVQQLPGGLTAAYLKVTYAFEGTDTWDILILDAGSYYYTVDPRSPTGSPAVRHTAVNAEQHPTVIPLNGQGAPLARNLPCTLATGTNLVTVTVGTSGVVFTNGQIVQFSTIGGTLPASVTGGAAYYIIGSSGATFNISLTSGGAAIAFPASSTPTCYVSQPAVYNTIRPYNRLPYAALGLPQAFTDVQ